MKITIKYQLLLLSIFNLNVYSLGTDDDILHNLSTSTYSKSYQTLEITVNFSNPLPPKLITKQFLVVNTLLTSLNNDHIGKTYRGTLILVNNKAKNGDVIEHNACTPIRNSYSKPWIAVVYGEKHSSQLCQYDKQIDNVLSGTNATAMILITNLIDVERLAPIPSPNKVGLLFNSNDWNSMMDSMDLTNLPEMTIQMPIESNGLLNRTSVLFASISFVLLLLISLGWLIFFYVQRFRTLHAKERLTRRLTNAAKKALSKIPVKTLRNGDSEISGDNEQCAVCIESYRSGDTVRILPCKHFFHKTCIDPWLIEQRSCPMCKVDILKACGVHLTTYTPKEPRNFSRSHQIEFFSDQQPNTNNESDYLTDHDSSREVHHIPPCPNCSQVNHFRANRTRHHNHYCPPFESHHRSENLEAGRGPVRIHELSQQENQSNRFSFRRNHHVTHSYYHRRTNRVMSTGRVWPNLFSRNFSVNDRTSEIMNVLSSCCRSTGRHNSSVSSDSSTYRNSANDNAHRTLSYRMMNSHVMKTAASQRNCPTCHVTDSHTKHFHHRHQVTAECQCGHVTELTSPDEEDAGSSSMGDATGAITVTVEPPEVQYHPGPPPSGSSGDSQSDSQLCPKSHSSGSSTSNCHHHHQVQVQLERRCSSSSCFSDDILMLAPSFLDNSSAGKEEEEYYCDVRESPAHDCATLDNNYEDSDEDQKMALLIEDGSLLSKV